MGRVGARAAVCPRQNGHISKYHWRMRGADPALTRRAGTATKMGQVEAVADPHEPSALTSTTEGEQPAGTPSRWS